MKTVFQWFAVFFALFSFTAGASQIIVDTDHDNVPDWEDYCPNTPPGKTVWTLETVKAGKGDPRWVGCTEGESHLRHFHPPLRDGVVANYLTTLHGNLARSFEAMAKASTKSTAPLYRKASLSFKERKSDSSSEHVLALLCEDERLLDQRFR